MSEAYVCQIFKYDPTKMPVYDPRVGRYMLSDNAVLKMIEFMNLPEIDWLAVASAADYILTLK